MHSTAMLHGRRFFEVYGPHFEPGRPLKVLDIGSMDLNGSLRETAPEGADYTGVDFAPGAGVDVVLDDPYAFPFPDETFDAVVSSSCFEHAELFWLTFLEALRVLKPRGLFYLNATASGAFHRHPVDCWRFYPDSGRALAAWARRNGTAAALLESFVSDPMDNPLLWTDFVAVFIKDEDQAEAFPRRLVDDFTEFTNGVVRGGGQFLNYSEMSVHQKKLFTIGQIVNNQVRIR
jgi:SAM-dependent methyltransferase